MHINYDDPPQQQTLFQLNKKIQYLKLLRSRNLAYKTKLLTLRDRLNSRLKQNQLVEQSTFKKTKKRLECLSRPISGVTFYDYDVAQPPELLNIYRTIRQPNNKERMFIRSIFESQEEEGEGKGTREGQRNVKCEEVVMKEDNPSAVAFHLVGNNSRMTGLEVYRAWRAKWVRKGEKQAMTEAENRRIEEYYNKYRDNWVQISLFLQGHTPDQIYYHYQRTLNQNKKRGRWQLRQKLTLAILVQHFGLGKWSQVYKVLRTRSDVQIRQKFCNILDPKLVINNWTVLQQQTLLQVAEKQQYRWSKIAKLPQFSDKTDNQIWRKFRNVMAEREPEEVRKLVRDGELRKKIEEFRVRAGLEKKEEVGNGGNGSNEGSAGKKVVVGVAQQQQ